MADDFLEKVKGFRSSLVIHSNANPYAAAAMMGMMAAKSQQAGRYFRPSDSFVAMLDGLEAPEHSSTAAADQIEVDFISDWTTYLRKTGLPACDLTYKESETAETNTLRFLNAHNRRIPAIKPRGIRQARELSVPTKFQADYEALVQLIETGSDLRPFLSRDILKNKRPDKNDALLNSWGFQHFHFRSEGTDHLLFCLLTEDEVYVIQALPHDAEYLWVNTILIQIVHDNWPHLIAHAKNSGLKPEVFSPTKRGSLRRFNANFPITVTDGTVYLPPAGGTTASGHSAEDQWTCRNIFDELSWWQTQVVHNATSIRTGLGMPVSNKLTVRMAFENQTCCFYEPTRAVRIVGFAALANS